MKYFNKIIFLVFFLTIILLFIADYFNPISYFTLYGTLMVLGLLLLFKGIYYDDKKVYKKNIKYYFLIYFITLIFTIFLVNRRIAIDFSNIFSQFQLIPFSLLFNTLTNSDLGFQQLIFNYVGNFSLLIPFALLLVTYDKKYQSYKVMFKSLLIFTLLIEITEVILGVGAFDIDDIILNISGGMFFLFLYNKFLYKLFNKVFFTNLNIKKIIASLFCIVLFICICFLNAKIIKEILYLRDLQITSDYIRGLYANRQKEFKIEDYTIYIDDLLVVFKHNGKSLEVDEINKDNISVSDITQIMDFVDEEEDFEKYSGMDVYLYRCKTSKKIIFSSKSYQEWYCSIKN